MLMIDRCGDDDDNILLLMAKDGNDKILLRSTEYHREKSKN
jgi:hypothetical protein